jgi:3-oxoadipate CoA-transferase, beta subunit
VHHTDSFLMIRGGHLDVAVLGAFQVSMRGDLANWATDDTALPPAVGGAMDLAAGAKQVFVLTAHTTRDGRPKIVADCTYPLTARAVVDRIYTDLAIIDVRGDGLVVRAVVAGLSHAELREATAAPLTFADTVGTLRGRGVPATVRAGSA